MSLFVHCKQTVPDCSLFSSVALNRRNFHWNEGKTILCENVCEETIKHFITIDM